jgi:hypothetical protein
MIRDRRKNMQLTKERVEKFLNRKQLSALLHSEQYGWRLRFVRNPLFQEPLPVLYNVKHNHLGILDPDGHINTDVRLKARPDGNRYKDLNMILHVSKPTENMALKERRKNKSSVMENLDELLNQHQQRGLRYVEQSGWELFCVRTSLFQEPVVIIVNSENDIFAALEHDGEMNMAPDLALREDDLPVRTVKQAISGTG